LVPIYFAYRAGSVANNIWRQVLRRYSFDSESQAVSTIGLPLIFFALALRLYLVLASVKRPRSL
jgi:hypothetical protein